MARKRLGAASGLTVEVISDLAFRLEPGEIGALIGPSGCGKSTLMRIIAGLDERYDGAVSRPPGPIGMAFQEPRLLPWRSVEDNIRLAAPQASDAEVEALLLPLGLTEHRAHYPGELSVGQQRRAALARAFAVKPALLLLDEPFVSLDAPLALALQRQLAALVAERDATTVLVTHDVEIANCCRRQINMRDGRIVNDRMTPSVRDARRELEGLLKTIPTPTPLEVAS